MRCGILHLSRVEILLHVLVFTEIYKATAILCTQWTTSTVTVGILTLRNLQGPFNVCSAGRGFMQVIEHDWLTEHRNLDLDARCNYCDTLTGPSLGYIVSGQGGSIRCSRGSERFVLTPSLPQRVKCRGEWCTDVSHDSAKKKTETVQGFKFCTFILVFKWHHGSEGVKTF